MAQPQPTALKDKVVPALEHRLHELKDKVVATVAHAHALVEGSLHGEGRDVSDSSPLKAQEAQELREEYKAAKEELSHERDWQTGEMTLDQVTASYHPPPAPHHHEHQQEGVARQRTNHVQRGAVPTYGGPPVPAQTQLGEQPLPESQVVPAPVPTYGGPPVPDDWQYREKQGADKPPLAPPRGTAAPEAGSHPAHQPAAKLNLPVSGPAPAQQSLADAAAGPDMEPLSDLLGLPHPTRHAHHPQPAPVEAPPPDAVPHSQQSIAEVVDAPLPPLSPGPTLPDLKHSKPVQTLGKALDEVARVGSKIPELLTSHAPAASARSRL